MSKEYTLTAEQLAKNIAGIWSIIIDKGMEEKGIIELIKASIKPTQELLKLAENYNVSNTRFKTGVLSQVQRGLEQEKKNRLLKVL